MLWLSAVALRRGLGLRSKDDASASHGRAKARHWIAMALRRAAKHGRCSERACKGKAGLCTALAKRSMARALLCGGMQRLCVAPRRKGIVQHSGGIETRFISSAWHRSGLLWHGISWHGQNIAPHCDGIAYHRIATDKRRSATRRPSTAPTSYAAAKLSLAKRGHCMAPLR